MYHRFTFFITNMDILPDDLWRMIGDYLYCDVEIVEDTVELHLRPARCYTILYEDGRPIISPGCVST